MRGFAVRAPEPLVGEVVAIRRFDLGDDGLLFPVVASATPWSARANTAVCRRRRHAAPDDSCSCGFYAFHRPTYLHDGAVSAVVAMWGRAIVGSRGLRAEHARIDAVCVQSGIPAEIRRRLRERYPGVHVFDDEDRMLLLHPLSAVRRRGVPAFLAASTELHAGVRLAMTAMVLALPFVDGVGRAQVTPWVLRIAAALLMATSLLFARAPRPSWRQQFSVGVPALAWLLTLPTVLAASPGVRIATGFAAIPVGLVLTLRRLRRTRQPSRTGLLVNLAAQQWLAGFAAPDWKVARRVTSRGLTIVDLSSLRMGVMLRYVGLLPGEISGLRAFGAVIRSLGADLAVVVHPKQIATVSGEWPPQGWAGLVVDGRSGVRGNARIAVEELIKILGLPAEFYASHS